MSKEKTPYLFLSYSHADTEAAVRLCSKLKKARIRHFRDTEVIAWGESIPKRVQDALQKATHMVVLISPGSEKSQWVAYEMGYGRGRNVKIVPFLLHPKMNVPGFISDLRYVSAGTTDEEEFIKSLKKQFRIPLSPKRNESAVLSTKIRSFRKLIISRSPVHRVKAIAAAASLGKAVLPVIHELLGHSHLEVAISAYKAAGEIHDKSSIPFLIAGLYPRRSSTRPQFPTAEIAASVLGGYSESVRLDALESIDGVVRPVDIQKIIRGISPQDTYPLVARLFEAKLLFEEWENIGGVSLLLQIDEKRAWPILENQLTEDSELDSFDAFRKVYPFISESHKKFMIEYYLHNPSYLTGFELTGMFERIIHGSFDKDWRVKQLRRLEEVGNLVYRRAVERRELSTRISVFLHAQQRHESL